jgi:hypothetical protein
MFAANRIRIVAGLCAVAWTMADATWAASCLPVTSGYEIGAGEVSYFRVDRATQPPTRLVQVVADADAQSFGVLRRTVDERGPCAGMRANYARDRKHVYYQAQVIVGADPKTYAFIDDNYARDDQAIYAFGRRLSTRVGSFQVLGDGYATDGVLHFYQDVVLEGDGFELLGSGAQAGYGYARTSSRVYRHGRWLAEADAKSFEVFHADAGITRDQNTVFFNDRRITGADPKTLEQVQAYVFKDRHAVYAEGQKIDGLDPATVRVSELGGYLIDSRAVFKRGKLLEGRDAASFAELQSPWSRDRNAVYYRDQPVPDVDVASFKTTGLNRAQDRNYRYEGLRRVCRLRDGDADAVPPCPP